MNVNISPQRLSDPKLLDRPNISLNGRINADTLSFFLRRLQDVRAANEHLVMELVRVRDANGELLCAVDVQEAEAARQARQ
ncbi:hypothetical protein SAMN04488498_11582 [Mesorhizobium albiziae]|uniref:Uncharacterized protein n=1 Tax=Neomesorhizobium albiziae TaxID=335020 RepID=A0A1I4D0G7_9HYPH|nr:hypothetical protein [Mesorhizobium albiziae]GLS28352.1 hypothetical protein GCM10007937_00590 [Mesorhizobium albiziae]SFK87114.1 hypothetical protein SAMN04488498_11582 [Mesorhizobium albiziae]